MRAGGQTGWLPSLQVADGLHFLHTEANQVHRTLCPHTIFITAMGAWKLGGLSLACPSFITAGTAGVVPISYRDASMERFMRWQQVGEASVSVGGIRENPLYKKPPAMLGSSHAECITAASAGWLRVRQRDRIPEGRFNATGASRRISKRCVSQQGSMGMHDRYC